MAWKGRHAETPLTYRVVILDHEKRSTTACLTQSQASIRLRASPIKTTPRLYMKKLSVILTMCLSALGASSANANQVTFPTYPGAGIIWIQVQPDIISTWDHMVYGAHVCVYWGTYTRCEDLPSKQSNYNYTISLVKYGAETWPITVVSSRGKVVNITQGNNPSGPYDTLLRW